MVRGGWGEVGGLEGWWVGGGGRGLEGVGGGFGCGLSEGEVTRLK